MNISDAEIELMRRESGLRMNAKNPNSTAFGVWQCIWSTCVAAAKATGTEPHTMNQEHQILQMRWYIENSKHKTAEAALNHQIAHKSY